MEEITLKNLPALLSKAYQLRGTNAIDEAFAIATACLQQFPEQAEVQCLYGILQIDQNHLFEAEKALNTAISLMPQKADFYYFLGELLRGQRRNQEAENAYVECLKLNDKHIYANLHLATLYDVEGHYLEATRYYQKTLSLDPNLSKAYYYLGVIYHRQDNIPAAIEHYEKALALDPKDIASLSNLGAALTKDRQFKNAIPCFEKALEISSDYVPALTNLGSTYIEMHDYAHGKEFMQRSLAVNPHLAANWRNLTLCSHFNPNDTTELDKILALMQEPGITEEDKIHYYFALGKIYDDMKAYDKAFKAYQQGNLLQAKRAVFVPEAFGDHIRRIKSIYDQIAFTHIEFPDTPNHVKPLIIMGTARSGKTLLEALLLQCPEIGGVGELGISEIPNKLPVDIRPKTNYPYWLKSFTVRQAKAIRAEYVKRLTRDDDQSHQYLIDTMPGNYIYLGLFPFLFPGVKIIHCQRNALDACLMMYCKFFTDGHGYSYDFKRLGKYYQQYLDIMAYWKQQYPDNILEVQYEALVTDPQKTLSTVMQFLQLDPNKVFDVSHIHQDEIDYWRHYETYLDPLKKALAEEIAPVTKVVDEKGEELKELLGSAYLSYHQGDTTTAEILCKTVLESDPNHFSALHLLGLIYFHHMEYETSLEFLERAVAIDASVLQLHVDIARLYEAMGKKMQAAYHIKLAEILQNNKIKNKLVHLTPEQQNELMSAFKSTPEIIDEFETRLLVKGKVDQELTSDSFKTHSWDHYFTDLSFGSYRDIQQGDFLIWRMRAWHFLFKNLALVDNLFAQKKAEIRVLDIGCASGYLRRFLEGNNDPKSGKKILYWGVDIRKSVLEDAVKGIDMIESGAQGNTIPSAFVEHDIKYGLPFKNSFFDYVVNFEMIKYLPVAQGKALLAEIYRVLSPKGLFFLSSSFTTDQPGYMESAPFQQLEDMLKINGFEILTKRGSQAHLHKILPHLKIGHNALVEDLLKIHPPEMVGAMIAPLYPEAAEQIMYVCKII